MVIKQVQLEVCKENSHNFKVILIRVMPIFRVDIELKLIIRYTSIHCSFNFHKIIFVINCNVKIFKQIDIRYFIILSYIHFTVVISIKFNEI